MFTIQREFRFSASHSLQGLTATDMCGRLHGHNYKVFAILEFEDIDEHGLTMDFGELDIIGKHIETVLDHTHLNESLGTNPTAEALAKNLYDQFSDELPNLAAIRVQETEDLIAEYRRNERRTRRAQSRLDRAADRPVM